MNPNLPNKPVAVIGYSGHGFVAVDILLCGGAKVAAYCDREQKPHNPFSLQYLGQETDSSAMEWLRLNNYFIAVGDNRIREKIYRQLTQTLSTPVNAIHPSAVISPSVKLEDGIMIAAGAVINPLSYIGKGAICNTSSNIDHECVVGDFAHIGPGTILCGNVKVGARTFVGAGAVVRQGITIGNDVMIGMGCVVVKDVPDGMVVVGNPQKELRKK
jgi:sugar O-acyltransferase (sialic acid O-acetyltransferase NeuD family)